MSIAPKNVNLKDVMHPSGVLYRNPTHFAEAQRAYDQSEIVQMVKQLGLKTERVTYTYEDKANIKAFPGMLHILDMDEFELSQLFKAIAKFRPNITRIRIATGTEYPDLQECRDSKIDVVSSRHPRFGEEIGKDIAALFGDDRLSIVDMVYYVTSASGDANFRAEAKAFSSKEKGNKDFFNPVVEIEYQRG